MNSMSHQGDYNWTFSGANSTFLNTDSVICGFRLSGMYEVLNRWLYYVLLVFVITASKWYEGQLRQ